MNSGILSLRGYSQLGTCCTGPDSHPDLTVTGRHFQLGPSISCHAVLAWPQSMSKLDLWTCGWCTHIGKTSVFTPMPHASIHLSINPACCSCVNHRAAYLLPYQECWSVDAWCPQSHFDLQSRNKAPCCRSAEPLNPKYSLRG